MALADCTQYDRLGATEARRPTKRPQPWDRGGPELRQLTGPPFGDNTQSGHCAKHADSKSLIVETVPGRIVHMVVDSTVASEAYARSAPVLATWLLVAS